MTAPAKTLKECFDKMTAIAEERSGKVMIYIEAMQIACDALGTIAVNKKVIDPAQIASEAMRDITKKLS